MRRALLAMVLFACGDQRTVRADAAIDAPPDATLPALECAAPCENGQSCCLFCSPGGACAAGCATVCTYATVCPAYSQECGCSYTSVGLGGQHAWLCQ